MHETSIQALLVEDNPGDIFLLQQMLADTPFWKAILTCTEQLQSALLLCRQQTFDIVLLDLSLPDSHGYATFERMRQQIPQTPIILLTGSDDQELALRAVRAGAQDYLVKGESNAALLIRAMRYAMERKRTEEALREHHLRYQALFENENIGVFIINVDGLLLNVNRQAARMVDNSVEELVNTPLLTYIIPDEHQRFADHLTALLTGQLIPLHEHTLLRHNGLQVPIEVDSSVVRNAAGDILYIQSIARDISKRKQAEAALYAEQAQLAQRVEERTKELSIANAELKRSARLKDEFLATISHELRTPLSVILTLAEALQDQIYGETALSQRKALERIVKSGRHLLELINDIIDVSKIESGKLALEIGPVSVTTLCEDCLQMVQATAQPKQIQFVKNFQLTHDLIYADGRRLLQILLNLLNNAVKFTPDKGRIGLEVYEDVEQERMMFTVWDTGIGIASDDLPKLFRPFVQLDSKLSRYYQGAGLGLALVYRLTRLHGGSVTVHSMPNDGSRFVIALPHQQRTVQPNAVLVESGLRRETSRASVVDFTSTRTSILLVDDNEPDAGSVKAYLERNNYRVVLVTNGSDAITQVQVQAPSLILIDTQVAQMDVPETVRQLRQLPTMERIPIVALTALTLPGEREACLAAGADAYMSKPICLQALYTLRVTGH
ncbi:MAG: response regulator [Caldilineaceae bacterium]